MGQVQAHMSECSRLELRTGMRSRRKNGPNKGGGPVAEKDLQNRPSATRRCGSWGGRPNTNARRIVSPSSPQMDLPIFKRAGGLGVANLVKLVAERACT